MLAVSEKITNEVLSLPSNERLILIDKLIKSLNLPLSSDIDKIWAKESERRLKELQNNEVEELDGELVFRELREKYNK
jgi:hypothetical protein